MQLRSVAVLAFIACSAAAQVATIEVERGSPAIGGGELVQSIGIETLGGVFTPLLEVGCRVPCEATNTFSTAADNQAEISVSLFRGTADLVSRNHSLGEFVVNGIPPAPRGAPQVAITVRAERTGIVLSATDVSGASLQLLRRAD